MVQPSTVTPLAINPILLTGVFLTLLAMSSRRRIVGKRSVYCDWRLILPRQAPATTGAFLFPQPLPKSPKNASYTWHHHDSPQLF